MILFYLFSLLLCVYESQQAQQYHWNKYKSSETAEGSHKRIVELMRSYYEEAHSRITHLNPLRFMYEESPYYEMGYITGEIIERYRKVLEHTQRPVRFLGMPLYDVLKRVELVQKLYFEIYHLVRMLHETPRKWVGNRIEFNNIEAIASFDLIMDQQGGTGKDPKDKTHALDLSDLFATQQHLLEQRKARQQKKRKLLKDYKKQRQIFLETMVKHTTKKVYNKWWPRDYGWEIDYEW